MLIQCTTHTPYGYNYENTSLDRKPGEFDFLMSKHWKNADGYFEMFVTMKPVCNDNLYNKIYFLWFIQ